MRFNSTGVSSSEITRGKLVFAFPFLSVSSKVHFSVIKCPSKEYGPAGIVNENVS